MLPKKTVENVLHVTPCVSDRMADAIQLWSDMYEGHSPWVREPTVDDPTRIVSLGLPQFIASEKARMATLEMKSEISAPVAHLDINSVPQMPENSDNTKVLGKSSNMTPQPNNQSNIGQKSKNMQGSSPIPGDQNAQTADNPSESGQTTLGNSPFSNISPSTAYRQRTVDVPKCSTERADFLNKEYAKLRKQIRRQLEYGIAKGGLVIKPYIVLYNNTNTSSNQSNQNSAQTDTQNAQKSTSFANTDTNNTDTNNSTSSTKTTAESTSTNDTNFANGGTRLHYDSNLPKAEIEFDFVQADRFFPLSFDANGKVIEAAFIQTKVDRAKERVYIRLEYHKLVGRTVTVENFAFESTDMTLANSNNIRSATELGRQISLKEVPEWATLSPKTVIEDVDRLLFAYFRMPEANTIDPYSPLGVSGYSRVIQLIKDADMQYSRLLWEYEGGELAIDVDRDALKFVEEENHSVLPQKQQRLFRKVDLNAEDTYNVFAPPLRDVSLVNGLNEIFKRIEDACGLSRGTIADIDMNQDAKTATELKIMKQRSYATNSDIQMALQSALEDTVYVMDVYCTLYNVTPTGEYEVSFEWDDSIIVDSESELSKRITLMQNGLASKLETRMWYFGETENQARLALQRIDEESRQAMMQNVQADVMRANAGLTPPGQEQDEDEDENDNKKSPADTTSSKISKGKQADSLNNPTKAKAPKSVKSGT